MLKTAMQINHRKVEGRKKKEEERPNDIQVRIKFSNHRIHKFNLLSSLWQRWLFLFVRRLFFGRLWLLCIVGAWGLAGTAVATSFADIFLMFYKFGSAQPIHWSTKMKEYTGKSCFALEGLVAKPASVPYIRIEEYRITERSFRRYPLERFNLE